MHKKLALYVIICASILFVAFQIYSFLHTMFLVETSTELLEEEIVIRSGNSDSNNLTITCNVDWGEDVLPDMLEIFKENNIKITFFISGKWAEKNPYLLRKIYLMGHEVQSHGYGHKLCSQISSEEIKSEIQKTEDAICELINYKTTVFAPPSGDYDKKTVEVCKEMGYLLSLWSIDTIDWRKGSTAPIILKRVLNKELPGGIILMHPKEETVKALPELIAAIKDQGIEIVPLHLLISGL